MTTATTSTLSLTVSQRLAAAAIALILGFTVLGTVGFAHNMAVHNGAHDYRHSMGFPCH